MLINVSMVVMILLFSLGVSSCDVMVIMFGLVIINVIKNMLVMMNIKVIKIDFIYW